MKATVCQLNDEAEEFARDWESLVEHVRVQAMKSNIRYEIILYWSNQDNAFIAEVPELPGCAADGPTYREALANAEIIIQEWIETARELGRPIPKPRGRLMYA